MAVITPPNDFPVMTLSLLAGVPKKFVFPNFLWDEVFYQSREQVDIKVSSDATANVTDEDATSAKSFWTSFGGDVDKLTRDDVGPDKEFFFETVANSVVEFSFRRLGIKR